MLRPVVPDLRSWGGRLRASIAAANETLPPDRVILAGVALAVAAALALIATQCIDFAVYDLHIRVLDSDTHRSVFGFMSLLAQASAVLVVGLRCLSPTRRGEWLVVGVLIAALLPARALLSGRPLAYALPVTIAFMLLWWLTAADHRPVRAVLRVGLLVLGFSFVVHVVGPKIVDHLGYGYGTWPYELKGMSKHTTELAGWILVSTGILAGWVTTHRPDQGPVGSAALREGQSAA